ncbi:uncharacterized protein LOC115888439 [Sitophilus oryzae]|uniref:Uncharacterized protein LOC115888439 n=1 Tax=Sitophilus oryzae TaxID=7048 RepID=A0A6J2YJ32_SITOR|nr:uncharacterized protein LOC115888439 [Sitophilus oryzae]
MEQNGSREGSQGSREWTVVDAIVTKQAMVKKRNIAMAWIDYQKAFDSVPHSGLVKTLEIYKINTEVIYFLRQTMDRWRTQLAVNLNGVSYLTDTLKIRRVIFQGDSLGPIWFCLALNPLSSMLKTGNYGYQITKNPSVRLTHLFYVDNLKLYATNRDQLHSLLELVSCFSEDIKMKFGISKCAYVNVIKGKIIESEGIDLRGGQHIAGLELGAKYKYLGVQHSAIIDHTEMKKAVESSFLQRVTKILKTELYSGAKVTAINSWAIPTISHTFGILKWSKTNLESIDRKSYNTTNRRDYFLRTDQPLHRALIQVDDGYSQLKLADKNSPPIPVTISQFEEEWKAKPLDGRYAANLRGGEVDKKLSTSYLSDGQLMFETEGFINGQVIPTRNRRKFILKEDLPSDKCRLCQTTTESIQRLTAGCTYLAPRDYLNRHNQVAGVIHQELCVQTGLLTAKVPYYKYQPQTVLENESWKILWDLAITTDRTVSYNRPDILVFDKKQRKAQVIDIQIPADENVGKSRMEKVLKYQELADEIKRMYQLEKVEIYPIIISCNGLVDKYLPRNLKAIGIRNPKQIVAISQKAVILATCHTVRRILATDGRVCL